MDLEHPVRRGCAGLFGYRLWRATQVAVPVTEARAACGGLWSVSGREPPVLVRCCDTTTGRLAP
jgi:hypothetical protein